MEALLSSLGIPAPFLDGLKSLDMSLSGEEFVVLNNYLELLVSEGRQFNLSAVKDSNEAWIRHMLDSLTLVKLMPHTGKVADVGSGGGLPGIPLAICRSGLQVFFVESVSKKANFLSKTVETLEITNTQVLNRRAEECGREPETREAFDFVTGRALAPLNIFLELTIPLLKVGGTAFAMKGVKAAEEVSAATKAMDKLKVELVEIHTSNVSTSGGNAILEFRKREQTPERYPRRTGIPNKRPL